MSTTGTSAGLPVRTLGRTGEKVSMIGLGGFHIGRRRDRALGVRLIRQAVDEGVTFMDNAWCYNDGESERIMGEALDGGYRDKVFLMTKNHGRDGETYRRQLEESLRRLNTEVIDLVQFHEIIDDGVPQRILSEGALEAAVRAREEGKIRYIGFTGHRWPHLFQEMLALDLAWDTVQLPINVLDAHYRSFAGEILPVLRERGIGVIGMKSLAAGRLLRTEITVQEAISYTLSQPIDTLVLGIDSPAVLQQNVAIARAWQPMSEAEQQALRDRAAARGSNGLLERYKTA